MKAAGRSGGFFCGHRRCFRNQTVAEAYQYQAKAADRAPPGDAMAGG